MVGMKLSVSLPDDDVSFVDAYAERVGSESRSAVLHKAIDLLRMADMESAYAEAWDEWHGSDDAQAWETTSGDGIADASR
jgi:Arc/MetJ-type ribon-helix-helix transcriptional regulator